MQAASSRHVVLTVLAAFAGCTAVALYSAAHRLPPDWSNGMPDFPAALLAKAWVHWDAGWYAHIARDGYWYTPGKQSPVAFFPAYPLVVGGIASLGLNRFWAGILVTVVCGAAGLWLFHRWALTLLRARKGPPSPLGASSPLPLGEGQGEGVVDPRSALGLASSRIALLALLLLALYPFAFYLYGVMYSDALFLLLVVGAFLCLERGWLWGAVLLGAMSTAARPVAPAVVVGLVVRQLELRRARGERLRPVDLMPALAAAGLGLYMLFLWHRFGDPLAFAHVQAAPGWDQPPGLRSWLKLDLWPNLRRDPSLYMLGRTALHGGIALGMLALVVPIWRRLGLGYALYVLVAVGIPTLSSKDFMGLGRYCIAAFPAFLMVALLLVERPRLKALWLVASTTLLLLLTAAFAADRYVS
ncbi:MAG: hypothetical protein L0Y64_03340 [Myxococcaceae bacterium]|nr:hypothetical protein [Myxococcaceae bacterium]